MLEYKGEIQNRCDKCDYMGYDFKLYEELLETYDGIFERVGCEFVVCPKCGYEERV